MKKGKFRFYTTKEEVKVIENLINSGNYENILLARNLIKTNKAYKHWKFSKFKQYFFPVTLENAFLGHGYKDLLQWLNQHSL